MSNASFRTLLAAVLIVPGFLVQARESGPYVPNADTVVVETLARKPGAPADRSLRELRDLRDRSRAEPANAELAFELARRLIERSRREADSRWLGQALASLTPWLREPAPPVEALVLRATIRQSLHDFSGALVDLEAALRAQPSDLAAWLTKATVHLVRAEFPAARRAGWMLAQLGDELAAVTISARLGSLTGQGDASYALLLRTLTAQRNVTNANPERQIWVLTELAEMAARLGRTTAAEQHFREALRLAPSDPYLLGAFADFLLDQGQPQGLVDRLRDWGRVDALLLRCLEAQASIHGPNAPEVRSGVLELAARFEAARQRGDNVHRREEARFRLRLLHDATGALALARENWNVQKEPADVRILLEAARAAHDEARVAETIAWIRQQRLVDAALALPATE